VLPFSVSAPRRACTVTSASVEGATPLGPWHRHDLERHVRPVRAHVAHGASRPVGANPEAAPEPPHEEGGLGAHERSRIGRLRHDHALDVRRERRVLGLIEEPRQEILPRLDAGPREVGDVGRGVRAGERGEADEVRDRGVLRVDDDAVGALRDLLEHRVVRVEAPEPDEDDGHVRCE
jgi:hypothetical protein